LRARSRSGTAGDGRIDSPFRRTTLLHDPRRMAMTA
jgi:hypothetical protein